MKKAFIIALSLVFYSNCYAQDYTDERTKIRNKLDSIINDGSSHDTLMAYAYAELSGILYTENMDTVIPLCEKAVEIVEHGLKKAKSKKEKTTFLQIYSVAVNNLGFVHVYNGNSDKGLDYYMKSLEIDKETKERKNESETLINIAYVYERRGLVEEALKHYFQSLEIKEEVKDSAGMGTVYNNIAFVYEDLEDFKNSKMYLEKSLKVRRSIGDKFGIGNSTNNIGYIHTIQADKCKTKKDLNCSRENYEIALKYFVQAIKIKKEVKDNYSLGTTISNAGATYCELDSMRLGLELINEGLLVSQEFGNQEDVSSGLHTLGKWQFHYGQLEEARVNATSSYELAKKIGYVENVRKSSFLLYEIYLKKRDYVKALNMHETYVQMKDSLNNEDVQRASSRQKAKHEYEKQKTIDDAENDKLVAIEKEQKEKQTLLTYATAGGLGLTGIFLFIVFNRLRVTKKQKVIIEEQKVEVENQKQEAENQRDIANTQKVIVEEKNKEILDSISYAKRIQEAILPPPRLVKEWLTESFIFYKPKDIVAGDFYWMETATYVENKKEKTLVYFAAADCTGHGVPGAMVSVVCANALNRAVKEFNLIEPGQVLDKVTELVIESFEKGDEDIKDGMDIALCALDISTKKVYYSGANNPLYRVTSKDIEIDGNYKVEIDDTNQLIEYKATKQPVGQYDGLINFKTLEIQLEPGDAIYVFSDGFPDQFGGVKGKKYKYSTFRKCLLTNYGQPMETQKQMLAKEFDNWKGDLEQVDDVCVIGVKINGVEKNNFTKRELEVLTHLQDGLPSKLIADKMSISKNTVDTYRRRLLAKTGTYNATELINYCIKKEII